MLRTQPWLWPTTICYPARCRDLSLPLLTGNEPPNPQPPPSPMLPPCPLLPGLPPGGSRTCLWLGLPTLLSGGRGWGLGPPEAPLEESSLNQRSAWLPSAGRPPRTDAHPPRGSGADITQAVLEITERLRGKKQTGVSVPMETTSICSRRLRQSLRPRA